MTKTLCAVCGLFCRACMVYIATREDPKRLKSLADRFGVAPEDMKCDGCRSERRGVPCRSCEFTSCAEEKGLEFCGACDTYPCEKLKEFNSQMPHRIELWEDNDRIRDIGCETWFKEKASHYSCGGCGTINSAYDLACRRCGRKPANGFVAEHGEVIREYWERINKREA